MRRSSIESRCLALAAALLAGAPARAAAAASLAGVHWYSGDSSMLDLSVPAGERGFNVEVIFDTGWCDGDPGTDPGDVRSVAATAKAHGLLNIIRIDYQQLLAVPHTSGEYASWATHFIKCTQELSDLSTLFIVGNEPNIEGNLTAGQYANAFNHLYSRKSEMPAGTQLLAAFNSPFTSPGWMLEMSSLLVGVDGFALHTGGVRASCSDPRLPCSYGGWPFDGAFRYYRDVISNIQSVWWTRPVYITEFNTYTGDPGSEPDSNYPANWINLAFEELRNYNASRGAKPPVKALCWFVDRPQSWPRFALRNIAAARTDMGEEFKNPANRSGSGTTPPGTNVARSAVGWLASSSYSAAYGGDKAYDGVVAEASKWTSNGLSATSWLALDLGGSHDLSGFIVRHAGSAGELKAFNTQAFGLESGTSLSGPWTSLAAVNNAVQNDISVVPLASPVTTRYVRLHITDAGIDNYARIPEFEVYGTPAGAACQGSAPTDHWKGEYFNNQTLSGSPALVRDDGTGELHFNWGSGGPSSCGVGVDHFSARWTRTLGFAAGIYRFTTRTDDGVRFYVDDAARIDKWFDRAASSDSVDVPLTAGHHTLRMEYYENGGLASAELSWQVIGPPPTTNLITNGNFDGGLAGWTTWSERGSFSVAVEGGQLHEWSGSYNGGVYQQFQTGGAGTTITVDGLWASDPTAAASQWAEVLVINGPRLPISGQDINGDQADVVLAYKNDTWTTPAGWSGPMEQTSPVAMQRSFAASGSVATIVLKSGNVGGVVTGARFDDILVKAATPPPPVNHAPTAVVSANPTSGPAPLAVSFSGTGSSDPDGDPLTYSWSFGDGGVASGVTVPHTYSAAGTYTATLTVDDGRGGTHSAEVVIIVDPASGNRPPIAVISANPRSATIPFTVTLDGSGSSDPDGDPLTYSWSFADGVNGSGPTFQRSFEDANGDLKKAGGYLVTLTVSDGQGGTGSASVRIGVFPPGCPPSLDFDAIRAQLDNQGKDLVFVKIGFHAHRDSGFNGLGRWEQCLDAAGVPFLLKTVNNSGRIAAAASLRARSGVPHVIVYRKCCEEQGVVYELPNYDNDAEQEAEVHWQKHLQRFPPDLQSNKHLIWVETINEPDKLRAEWLARFSYHTALKAMAAGYNYAAFGWSSGEPEPGPPPRPGEPSYQWDGPEMQNFLRLAAQHPDRIAIALHEYDYVDPTLRDTYPDLVGRFERLFERCDVNGIPRPTVLITEFGWPGPPPAEEAMSPDNIPWAADLYARFRSVKGAAIWDEGDMSSYISALTEYSLQNYFAIPR